MRKAWIVLGVGALLGGCASERNLGRPSVAPWDFADAPNPNPGAPSGAPPVHDPARLVRANGPAGQTDNGYRVTLISIGRKLPQGGEDVTPDSLAVWRPDGAPALVAPSQNMVGGGAAAGLIDHGARLLSFEIRAPRRDGQASVMGYLPEGAKEGTPHPELHGWDIGPMNRLWSRTYSTWIVVDDRKATRYRVAFADEEWRPLDRVKVRLDRRVDEILHEGDGYRLHHIVIPRPFAVTKWTLEDEYGRWVAEPNTLAPNWEYRVRFEYPGEKLHPATGLVRYRGEGVAVVERRPWHWLELSGIHFDPDAAKWPKGGLWGDEGKPTIRHADGVALEAIAAFEKDPYQGWSPTAIYSPGGQRWRAHPDGSGLRPRISGGQPPKDTLLAVLRFDEGRVSREHPALVDVLPSSSGHPGKGLGKSVARFIGDKAAQDVTHVPFTRPALPYIQVSVRYADPEWKTEATVPFPELPPFPVSPELRAAFAKGTVSADAFDVSLYFSRTEGAQFKLRLSAEPQPRLTRKIDLREGDQEGRIVARLKSGERIPLEPNTSGFGGNGDHSTGVTFYLDRDGGAHYHDNVTSREFKMANLAAFEVQVRGYGPPSYLPAKLP